MTTLEKLEKGGGGGGFAGECGCSMTLFDYLDKHPVITVVFGVLAFVFVYDVCMRLAARK